MSWKEKKSSVRAQAIEFLYGKLQEIFSLKMEMIYF
jgi:hypothetical protein